MGIKNKKIKNNKNKENNENENDDEIKAKEIRRVIWEAVWQEIPPRY